MANARITNTAPNARIGGYLPNTKVSSFQTGHAGERNVSISRGTPIGLLLALTYSEDFVVVFPSYSDYRPNVRIQNL